MLSKSQARWFFILFTAGFSLVFLLLTIDTVRSVPARSHEENLTPQVVRGKEIWDSNNCMGCHTLLGEGAYYAPELTKVVDRRGAAWIKVFLKDPQAMFPGKRKMIQYDFTDEEMDDVIAFFTWIGGIDTNGFPPKPDLVVQGASVPTNSKNDPFAGSPPVFKSLCVACHAIENQGGVVGPALDDVADRFNAETLDAWLKDPKSIKPDTTMPDLNLDKAQREALTKWLLDRKNTNKGGQ